MRENCSYGSEGGEANSLPYPYPAENLCDATTVSTLGSIHSYAIALLARGGIDMSRCLRVFPISFSQAKALARLQPSAG
jgi:hypothetical protein